MDLYVSDLDGTLLGLDGLLSGFGRRVLAGLLADGLHFTVASARSVVSMRHVLGDLPLSLPVIALNGAFLSDFATGRHLWVNAIPEGLREDVLDRIVACGARPFVSTSDGGQECVYYESLTNDGMAEYVRILRAGGDPRVRDPRPLRQCLAGHVVCFTVIDRAERLAALETGLRQTWPTSLSLHVFENSYQPGWHWLTAHDARATKDQGLRTLRALCGLGECRVTVFGDHANDLGLMRAADRAVAVANALDEVKACASQIIGSNEDDSVVRFLVRERGRPTP